MVTYLIKSGICLALLLAFYHLILEREKMHRFNRFYLLGSVLFSFLAPFYKIYIETIPNTLKIVPSLITNSNLDVNPVKEINYTQYLFLGYTIVAIILLIRFTKNLFNILLKIKQYKKIKKEKATLVLVDDVISPHTFWNYIFINEEEYNSNKIETELYTHELTHALQKHTFDVLLIEFLQVMFWINPTFIFLKKAIKLNHEFLADNEVITTHKNTTEYQYLLLNRAAWNNEYYLASNLNYLLTKKRLQMMTKQSSRTKILLKKLAVVPVLVGFTFLFAERVEAYENINEFLDSEITQSELPKEQITTNSSSLEDVKNKLNNANSLKMSVAEKKDTFNVKLSNGEHLKVWETNDSIPQLLKQKTGHVTANNQTLFYVKNEKGTNYYNRWGQLVTKEGKIITPEQTHSNQVIPSQNISKVYKNGKVTNEFKKTNLPPPPPKSNFPEVKKGEVSNIPPPPPPVNAVEYIQQNKDADFYFDNKKVSYKEIINLVKDKKGLNTLSQKNNDKKVIKFYSKKLNKNTSTVNTSDIKYYLDGKLISKEKLDKIAPKNIKKVDVKKNKDGTGSVYVTSNK